MEDEPTGDKVVSTQKQLQTSHDPGWNDPPKWAYSPTLNSSGSTPTKRLLNKRVAFPLSSTTSSISNQPTNNQQLPQSTNLPPPLPSSLPTAPIQPITLTSAPHAPLATPSIATREDSSSEFIIDKEQGLNDTFDNLNSVINHVLKDDSKLDEIQKRLEIMKSMWTDDKLNSEIHKKVFEICRALQSDDIDMADKIHVSLMMNHGTVCSTWISAIRHLILAMKEKKKVESEEITDKTQPLLLPNPMETK